MDTKPLERKDDGAFCNEFIKAIASELKDQT